MMDNILLLTHPEADYNSLYLRVCYPKNVIEFPIKYSYHGMTDYYKSPPLKHFFKKHPYVYYKKGCTAPSKIFFLEGDNGKVISKELNVPYHHPEYSLYDISKKLRRNEFEYLVMESPRDVNTFYFDILKESIPSDADIKLILIDGEDYSNLRWDIISTFKTKVPKENISYFKRELYNTPENIRLIKNREVFPICFPSILYPLINMRRFEKDIDIFFFSGDSDILRKKSRLVIKNSEKLMHFNILISNTWEDDSLSYEDYCMSLVRSKIGLSVRGYGWNCLRDTEVPSFKETLLFIHESPQLLPYPNLNGKECVTFTTNDLVSKLVYYLKNEEERRRIAKAGNEHLLKHHTNTKMLEYISKIVEGEDMPNYGTRT